MDEFYPIQSRRLSLTHRPEARAVARPLDLSCPKQDQNKENLELSSIQPLNETLGMQNMSPNSAQNAYNTQITNQFKVVWIMKWVDYTNK